MKNTGILIELVMALYKNKNGKILEICVIDAVWKYNDFKWRKGNIDNLSNILLETAGGKENKLEFYDLFSKQISSEVTMVSAGYKVISTNNLYSSKRIVYNIVLAVKNGKASYIHINNIKKREIVHNVRANNEEFYNLNEDDVLYIESMHNNVIWHCVHMKIVSTDSLCNLESIISSDFVRIQRSYLANRKHMKIIRRCEVVMDNGDILPIPVRKYVQIKEKLMYGQSIYQDI